MMKKITLLMMFFVGLGSLQAQTFDFNDGTTQGWDGAAGGTLTANGTDVTLSWVAGKKPKMVNASAGVNADANPILKVVIKNNTEITELKVRHLKASDGTNRFVKFDIAPNKASWETYYFDLTNAEWAGTQDDIQFIFSVAGSNTTSDASLDVDEIAFIDEIPLTEKYEFYFDTDGDTEGFDKNSLNSMDVTGGNLVIDPKATKYAGIEQLAHYVEADTYKTVEIRLKNNSTGDTYLFFAVANNGGSNGVTITTGDSDFTVYKIDLGGLASWTGQQSGYKIRFGENSTDKKSTGTGTIEIDYIKFTTETLSTDDVDFVDDAKIKLYPNPASGLLSISAPNPIEKVEVFNMLGQKTISKTDSLQSLNISRLEKGIYILKIYQKGNIVSSKRFIKQ